MISQRGEIGRAGLGPVVFGLRFLDRVGKNKQLIDLRDLQRVQQTLRRPHDDEITAGIFSGNVCAYEATYPRGVNVRNVRNVQNQKVSMIAPHHRLEAKKVIQQQRAVQAEYDARSTSIFDSLDI